VNLSLIEQLERGSRREALERFLQAWYGVPGLPPVLPAPHIPAVVEELLTLATTIPLSGLNGGLNIHAPYEVDTFDDRGALMVFCTESDGVFRWAYRPWESDPVVWLGTFDPDRPFPVEEPERLTGFLLQVCVQMAIWTAPCRASEILGPTERAYALAPLRAVLQPFHLTDPAPFRR
jgi:hypothetical protein